jgi:hypothetical protein
MSRKRYAPEQIVGMLCEAKVGLPQGNSTILRGLGVSKQSACLTVADVRHACSTASTRVSRFQLYAGLDLGWLNLCPENSALPVQRSYSVAHLATGDMVELRVS